MSAQRRKESWGYNALRRLRDEQWQELIRTYPALRMNPDELNAYNTRRNENLERARSASGTLNTQRHQESSGYLVLRGLRDEHWRLLIRTYPALSLVRRRIGWDEGEGRWRGKEARELEGHGVAPGVVDLQLLGSHSREALLNVLVDVPAANVDDKGAVRALRYAAMMKKLCNVVQGHPRDKVTLGVRLERDEGARPGKNRPHPFWALEDCRDTAPGITKDPMGHEWRVLPCPCVPGHGRPGQGRPKEGDDGTWRDMQFHDRGEAQLEKVDGLGVTLHFVRVALEASSVGYVPMQMGQPGQGRRLLSSTSNEVIETGGEAGRDGRCGYIARVQVSVVCRCIDGGKPNCRR